METPRNTVGTFFKTLNLLFAALLAGQVLFAGLAVYTVGAHVPPENQMTLDHILDVVVMAVMISGFFMSNYFYRLRLQEARNEPSLAGKLAAYKTALMLRLSLLEAPALITTFAYLLTGDKVFMGMAVVVILFFISLKPSRENAAGEMKLEEFYIQDLKNKNTVL